MRKILRPKCKANRSAATFGHKQSRNRKCIAATKFRTCGLTRLTTQSPRKPVKIPLRTYLDLGERLQFDAQLGSLLLGAVRYVVHVDDQVERRRLAFLPEQGAHLLLHVAHDSLHAGCKKKRCELSG